MSENIQQLKMDCYNQLNILKMAISNISPEDPEISRIEDMMNKLNYREYNVGVVGEFNRGKSSLINALLGANILPADIIPTTATVNRVIWSQKAFARLDMRDGTVDEDFPINKLKNHVTKITSDNQLAAEKVKEAVIGYPTQLCKNNVSILDTPGLNESPEMDKLTYEQADKMDALIFTLRLDYWFSESEALEVCQFLDYKNIHHILFTIGFIDLVREEEDEDIDQDLIDIRKEIIKKTTRVIDNDISLSPEEANRKKQMIESAAVMGISAKDALDSFVNGNNQQLIDSRIEPYKHELMARLNVQVDDWIKFEVLPYLQNKEQIFEDVVTRAFGEDNLNLQIAQQNLENAKSKLQMLPSVLNESLQHWKSAIYQKLGEKDALKKEFKDQMFFYIEKNKKPGEEDLVLNDSSWFERVKSEAKKRGVYRGENDPITKNFKMAYETVKSRMIEKTYAAALTADQDLEPTVNTLVSYSYDIAENIMITAKALSIDDSEKFKESALLLSADLQKVLDPQNSREGLTDEKKQELSNKYLFGESGENFNNLLTIILKFCQLDTFTFPDQLMTDDLTTYKFKSVSLDNYLDNLKKLQAGNITWGFLDGIYDSQTNDFVNKLSEIIELKIQEIETGIRMEPSKIISDSIGYFAVLTYEMERQQDQYRRQQEKTEYIKEKFSIRNNRIIK